MTILHVDETYGGLPNSGRLSGTNGDLVGIMDVALVANGWAIEYTSGLARVYRPGTGNRFRLHMNDDSAVSGNAGLCVVRGCENASAATTLVDPFPTVALVANNAANWLKSNAVSTAARAFDIWVGTTWVIYAVNYGASANGWEVHFFGDCPPSLAGDSYNTLCFSRRITTTSSTTFYAMGGPSGGFASPLFCWARCFDGTVKSTTGWSPSVGSTSIGLLSAGNPAFLSPTLGIDTQKVSLTDSGTGAGTSVTSTGLQVRGWLPNILDPLHRSPSNTLGAGPQARDSYTNTAYNAAFVGKVVRSSNSGTTAFLVVEESDTWSPPSG